MRLRVGRLEAIDRHVGVDLRRRQGGVPEELLDHSKVGTTLEEMGGGAVPQAVRAEVGRVGYVPQQVVHHRADLALVCPLPATTEKEGGTTLRGGQAGTALLEPGRQRPASRDTERDPAFLIPLAEDPQHVHAEVHVVDVERHELDRKSVV